MGEILSAWVLDARVVSARIYRELALKTIQRASQESALSLALNTLNRSTKKIRKRDSKKEPQVQVKLTNFFSSILMARAQSHRSEVAAASKSKDRLHSRPSQHMAQGVEKLTTLIMREELSIRRTRRKTRKLRDLARTSHQRTRLLSREAWLRERARNTRKEVYRARHPSIVSSRFGTSSPRLVRNLRRKSSICRRRKREKNSNTTIKSSKSLTLCYLIPNFLSTRPSSLARLVRKLSVR